MVLTKGSEFVGYLIGVGLLIFGLMLLNVGIGFIIIFAALGILYIIRVNSLSYYTKKNKNLIKNKPMEKIYQIKSKIEKWKVEGYNVEEIEKMLEEMK